MQFDPESWPACWILDMIARNGDCAEFYTSGHWRKCRKAVRKNQHNECWCHLHPDQFPHLAGRPPEIRRGNTVHHLYPVRERPDLALSETAPDGSQNLICICESCHGHIHHPSDVPDIPERW